MASKIKCLNPDCNKKFIPKRKDRKYCSPKCKADYHNKQKKAEIENLKNQLLEKKKPQEIEPPKIDNAEVQKLKNENSELKKEIENKNAEIQNLRKKAKGIIDKERGKIKKLEAQNEKFKQSNEKLKLELKKAKQPPANLKSRLIIFKAYKDFCKKVETYIKKKNVTTQKYIDIDKRINTFDEGIENANIEQIFYSFYDEYEGKSDGESKRIKNRIDYIERELEEKVRMTDYLRMENCGIENYQKQDSDLFFKYYARPKN